MKVKQKIKLVFTVVFITIPFLYTSVQGFTSFDNCLITSDIGIFTYESQYSHLGNAPGIVGSADHFKLDHTDSICTGAYSKNVDVSGLSKKERFKVLLNLDVQVTQHAGVDSDKWLLHEIEKGYRSSKQDRLGIIIPATRIREINGNKIIGRRGNGYRWVRNNTVIDISYTDLDGTKPEPLEVVQAYLAKFPSTITITDTVFKSNDYNIQWIKDEMERRLWLCDKWSMQLQLGKVSQSDMLTALVDNMTIFLNYRQKYFGVSADNDLAALTNYLAANDGTSIKKKLDDYKTWWAKNKDKKISL